MNKEEIKELIHLIDQSSLKYFELENASVSLKLSKRESDNQVSTYEGTKDESVQSLHETEGNSVANKVHEAENSGVKRDTLEETTVEDESLHIIKSPIVGTSYRSSSPDSPAFVKAGDSVEAGQTVLIIEAMKVMNEIKSDVSGIVQEILVDDGQAIEFDQALIKIKVN